MLSTACYESRAYEKDAWPSASTLAWPILDAERFSDLSFDLLVQAGMKMGLTQKRARDRLVAMQADILNEAKALLEATESEDAQLRQALGLGIRLEGERRCLRAAVYPVVGERVRQLETAGYEWAVAGGFASIGDGSGRGEGW